MKKVKMSDIAKVVGVSNVTVSKALGNKEGVSEKMRQEIKKVAKEMGYYNIEQPHLSSKRLIGIFISKEYIDQEHSFYWDFYKKIVAIIKEYHYNSIIEVVASKDDELPSFVDPQWISGIFVIGGLPTFYLKQHQETNIPIVIIDSQDSDLDITSIQSDNYNDSYRMTDYLIKKGYQKIGFVGSIHATVGIQDRYLGYCKALFSNKIMPNEKWLIEDRDGLEFKKTFDLPDELPEAFVCNCDQTAYYFMEYLKSQGYRIPEDIAIVGYYDYVYSKICSPQLTTIHVDLENMARGAVKSLFLIHQGDVEPRHILLKGEIVERDSVK